MVPGKLYLERFREKGMNEVPTSQRKTEQQGRRMLPAARSLESGSEQLWAREDNEPAVTEGDDAADVCGQKRRLSLSTQWMTTIM